MSTSYDLVGKAQISHQSGSLVSRPPLPSPAKGASGFHPPETVLRAVSSRKALALCPTGSKGSRMLVAGTVLPSGKPGYLKSPSAVSA